MVLGALSLVLIGARGEVRRVVGETWRENPVVVFRVSKQDFFFRFLGVLIRCVYFYSHTTHSQDE